MIDICILNSGVGISGSINSLNGKVCYEYKSVGFAGR